MTLRNSKIFGVKPFPGEASGRRLEDHPSSPPISFSQWSFLPPFGSGVQANFDKNWGQNVRSLWQWANGHQLLPGTLTAVRPWKCYNPKRKGLSSVFQPLPSFFQSRTATLQGCSFMVWSSKYHLSLHKPPTCSKSSVNCSDKFSPALPKPQGFYGVKTGGPPGQGQRWMSLGKITRNLPKPRFFRAFWGDSFPKPQFFAGDVSWGL